MSGKFMIKDVGNYTKQFDNFVEAETEAKRRRAHSSTDDQITIVQAIATVEMPTKDAFTTVL